MLTTTIPADAPTFNRFWFSYHPLPCPVYLCIPYVDSVALFFACGPRGCCSPLGLPPNVVDRVKAAGAGSVFPDPCVSAKDGHCWGWFLWVHQPSRAAIVVLNQLQNEYGATLSRLHIAYDFFTRGDVVTLHQWLLQHMVLKWRRRAALKTIINAVADTAYWQRESARRNVIPYCDNLSKVTHQPCSHIELRFTGSSSIKRGKLKGQVKNLLTLNPAKLFKQHIKLVTCEGWNSFINRMIRQKVKADRLQHLKQRPKQLPTTERFREQYRANLPDRVRAYYNVLTQGEMMQRIKEIFPNLGFEEVSLEHLKLPYALQYVGIKDEAKSRDVSRDVDVGTEITDIEIIKESEKERGSYILNIRPSPPKVATAVIA
jgi:hypothetical protein